jgi:hypothetical protein
LVPSLKSRDTDLEVPFLVSNSRPAKWTISNLIISCIPVFTAITFIPLSNTITSGEGKCTLSMVCIAGGIVLSKIICYELKYKSHLIFFKNRIKEFNIINYLIFGGACSLIGMVRRFILKFIYYISRNNSWLYIHYIFL